MANATNQGVGDATLHPLVQGAGSHPPLLTVGIPCLPLIIEDRKFKCRYSWNPNYKLVSISKIDSALNPFCSDVGAGCGISGGFLLVNDGKFLYIHTSILTPEDIPDQRKTLFFWTLPQISPCPLYAVWTTVVISHCLKLSENDNIHSSNRL